MQACLAQTNKHNIKTLFQTYIQQYTKPKKYKTKQKIINNVHLGEKYKQFFKNLKKKSNILEVHMLVLNPKPKTKILEHPMKL